MGRRGERWGERERNLFIASNWINFRAFAERNWGKQIMDTTGNFLSEWGKNSSVAVGIGLCGGSPSLKPQEIFLKSHQSCHFSGLDFILGNEARIKLTPVGHISELIK